MLDITVRTLDSQNHPFSVEDEMTVSEFKQHIASTVDISPDIQRIIYCGRVLTNEDKLKDLDLHGKVVHLVQRVPPSDSQSNSNQNGVPSSQQSQRSPSSGNTMYFGSIEIPWDADQMLPPLPPAHSLAASRLNVAKRMLRRAEATIALLENPSAGSAGNAASEEPQEESNSTNQSETGDDVPNEINTVFEARVIIPASSSNANIQQALINALQNSLPTNNPITLNVDPQTTPPVNDTNGQEESTSEPAETQEESSSSPMENQPTDPPASSSTNQSERTNARPENISRTSEMADLLETLSRLQVRFAPFLDTYQQFMRDDPVLEADDVRRTQVTMTRVSEVLHLLGHAYHSLSDIILRVRMAPPRPLLCRPILIQNSTIVEADFPIQVEAQINLSPSNNHSATQSPTNNAAGATDASRTNNGSNNTTNRSARAQITPQLEFMNITGYPASGVHVQSIPWSTIGRGARNRSAEPPQADPTGTSTPTTTTPPPSSTPTPNANNGGGRTTGPTGQMHLGNRNIQFFTESFTIDSVDGSNPADGARGGASMDLIQSLMQIAGQLVNRANVPTTLSSSPRQEAQPPPPSNNTTSSSSSSSTTQQQQQNNQTPGQNSQARGNTQTNPTTATYTRSTPRPHVHSTHPLHGFDPFLPCNSHHILCRRRAHHASQAQQQAASGQSSMTNNNAGARRQGGIGGIGIGGQQQGTGAAGNPILSVIQGVLNSFQNVYNRRPNNEQQAAGQQATNAGGGTASPQSLFNRDFHEVVANIPNILLPHLQNMHDTGNRGPTIAQILQQAGDQSTGTGIINDIIMLISRNLTITDISELNSGRLDSLMRMRADIRAFVLERILERNAPTMANVDRASERLIQELQPIFDNYRSLAVQDDIDIVRTLQRLCRARLPNIINLAISRRPDSMRCLVDNLQLLSRYAVSLVLHASANGPQGVEELIGRLVTTHMEGIAPEIQQWTILTTSSQLQRFTRYQTIHPAMLTQYIVRNVDSITASSDASQANEPMDVDADASAEQMQNHAGASTTQLGPIDIGDSSEDMPTVVIGSEPWHDQVPTDWVPIITRDEQRQRRQNNVAFSDAYLSGMPTKRRKVVSSSKPQGSLPQVITDSIRRAVNTCGLSVVQNVDAVAEEAGANLNIQSAYRELLRTSVQASVQDNEDFTADRFPNATNYFNKSQ